MMLGDFETAWRVSDVVLAWRRHATLNCRDQPFHLRHVWNGAPLEGRHVLVRCYHGLGDTVQFIRYMPMLHRIAASVTVQAVPALHDLLRAVSGIDRIVALDRNVPDPPFDADIELMELPHAFRTALATIPDEVPYLAVDAARIKAARRRMCDEPRLKVGIAWSVGGWDRQRAMPLAAFAPVAAIADVALFNLQRGPALAEIASPGHGVRFADDAASWTNDILDTAATIRTLDLVVSVDTMVAHLAGALGVPVWTMLHAGADWRWMTGRADSPWYPTMRLFRQTAPKDWESVITAIVARLRREPAFSVSPYRRAISLPADASAVNSIRADAAFDGRHRSRTGPRRPRDREWQTCPARALTRLAHVNSLALPRRHRTALTRDRKSDCIDSKNTD